MLQTITFIHKLAFEVTSSSILIRSLPKMRSYFQKLYVTNGTIIFMRDLHFNAAHFNAFFAACQRYRSISAKQALKKGEKTNKRQVGQN